MANPMLDQIRRSLGRTSQSPVAARPEVYPPRQTGSTATEIERFFTEVHALSGEGQVLGAEAIPGALQDLVTQQQITRATAWDSPLLKELDIAGRLGALGVEMVPPSAGKFALAGCDLGITGADYALPETGTLVLRSSPEKPRAVSLLPRIHLAILRPSALRADLHQVFSEAKDSPYLVFITGPSRTSDIELTVTLGVHGPKNLYVWMLES